MKPTPETAQSKTGMSSPAEPSVNYVVYNMYKNKQDAQTFVHLVDLYTYCRMMHGAYNVKLRSLHTTKNSQQCSVFMWCQTSSAKFSLHAGNMKFATQNGE